MIKELIKITALLFRAVIFILFGQDNNGDFMNIRTDLISEQQTSCDTAFSHEEQFGIALLSTVKIESDNISKKLNKPKGIYCTVSFPSLETICDTEDIINATVRAFKKVTEGKSNTLVVGLGNTDITPDALGPITCNGVLATRHLSKEFKQTIGLQNLKSVCCINPGVLGKTGIESYDLICSAAKSIKPDTIIAVDALACRSPDRLCRTIQISDSGICPGAGVNNSRKELSLSSVGIPVIAVGVPTVIDANSFFEGQNHNISNMMVTPKEIDFLIEKSAEILSRALNIFLQPALDISVIESLT